MVEYLAELDERHFRLGTGGVHHLAAEGLPHGVRAEMADFQGVFTLDFLQDDIDALRGKNLILPGEKHGLGAFGVSQFLVAVLYMLLESAVDADASSLAGFLLKELKGIRIENLAPAESLEVADTQPKKAAAAD